MLETCGSAVEECTFPCPSRGLKHCSPVKPRLAPESQSWDIRGAATGSKATVATVLPGREQPSLQSAIVCKTGP
jgi:hypothetical protein